MDERLRGTEMPRSSLRKFMNDPKSSVMSYLADNMAAQQIQPHVQQQNHGPNTAQQSNPLYGQQYQNQGSNRQSNRFSNHINASQTSLNPSQLGQNNESFQSVALQPGQGQNPQMPPIAPFVASNVGGILNQSSEIQAGDENINEKLQQQSSNVLTQQQIADNQRSDISLKSLGKPPPTSGMRHSSSPKSAPRLYHRMNLDFEVTKSNFFTARAQHNSQEMTSAAYELESLSRRIWSLRFEHAWEFEDYEDTGHRAVIAHWQAQYELWADTVLDIQEGDSAASMFAVHRTSSSGTTALAIKKSISSMIPQVGGTNLKSSYDQSQRPSYQDIRHDSTNQAHLRAQQDFTNQNSTLDQKISVNQAAQRAPSLQYLPPDNMPGGFPVSGTQPASGSSVQQSLPFQQQSPPLQQQSMTPPPQQAGSGQFGLIQGQNRPPPNEQNGPPVTGASSQNNQSIPQHNQPNIQRGPLQQIQSQQTGQQMQGGPPLNAQQSPYAPYTIRIPPSGPNSNSLPPQEPMSQLSLGRSQPPRQEGYPQQGARAEGR